jgi:hypothetical protein
MEQDGIPTAKYRPLYTKFLVYCSPFSAANGKLKYTRDCIVSEGYNAGGKYKKKPRTMAFKNPRL